ncbi:hypothetical protein C8R43DRAFT_1142722 [Mycena crocata]|nr:hypothetical protein C8R43DRAFT_1142722 [Mycena crocata]
MAISGYELLPTNAGARATTTVRPTAKRYSRFIWIVAGIFTLIMLFFIAVRQSKTHRSGISGTTNTAAQKRVYLRAGGIGNEGFGSALNHFKQSIILSRALQSDLVLSEEESEHHYSTSAVFNGPLVAASMDTHTVCRIRDHIPHHRRDAVVRGWCAGEPTAVAELQRVSEDMRNCTGIVELDEDERTEDLTGCIMGWVRERLDSGPSPVLPPQLSWPPTRRVTVGVHLRWGDSADWSAVPGHGLFRGSMSLENVVRVLNDIRTTPLGAHGVELTVAMENADAEVLQKLGQAYTLLDSGDGLADVRALSRNDVLLLGDSAYGCMAHMLAPPGLTIAELSVDQMEAEVAQLLRSNLSPNKLQSDHIRQLISYYQGNLDALPVDSPESPVHQQRMQRPVAALKPILSATPRCPQWRRSVHAHYLGSPCLRILARCGDWYPSSLGSPFHNVAKTLPNLQDLVDRSTPHPLTVTIRSRDLEASREHESRLLPSLLGISELCRRVKALDVVLDSGSLANTLRLHVPSFPALQRLDLIIATRRNQTAYIASLLNFSKCAPRLCEVNVSAAHDNVRIDWQQPSLELHLQYIWDPTILEALTYRPSHSPLPLPLLPCLKSIWIAGRSTAFRDSDKVLVDMLESRWDPGLRPHNVAIFAGLERARISLGGPSLSAETEKTLRDLSSKFTS